MWSWLDTVFGLAVGFVIAPLAFRGWPFRRPNLTGEPLPVVQCGNCGQLTSAFCKEHRDAIKAGWRS